MIFGKRLLNIKCVFRFSLQLSSETFVILSRIKRNIIANYVGLHVKYSLSCQILINLDFSRQIFKKYSNMNFHENPSSGSRVFPCGRTDRQAGRHMTKLLIAFRIFAHMPQSILETAILQPLETYILFTRGCNIHTFPLFLQCYPSVTTVVRLCYVAVSVHVYSLEG
jgi:hypothetical protein